MLRYIIVLFSWKGITTVYPFSQPLRSSANDAMIDLRLSFESRYRHIVSIHYPTRRGFGRSSAILGSSLRIRVWE